jgi:hypothetical protein
MKSWRVGLILGVAMGWLGGAPVDVITFTH